MSPKPDTGFSTSFSWNRSKWLLMLCLLFPLGLFLLSDYWAERITITVIHSVQSLGSNESSMNSTSSYSQNMISTMVIVSHPDTNESDVSYDMATSTTTNAPRANGSAANGSTANISFVQSQQTALIVDSYSRSIAYSIPRAPSSEPVVFLIGFHKVGTRSTYNLFRRSGIDSVHNNRFNDRSNGTTLISILIGNYRANRPILTELSPPFRFFSDFGITASPTHSISAVPWYRLAVDQYPGSKFILQIRSVNKWLHSRFTHRHSTRGFIPDAWRQSNRSILWNGTVYHLADYDEESGNILLLKSWKEEWYQYMCDVLQFFYFERSELSSDLLIFDIEQDDAQKIADFAAGFGMHLNVNLLHPTGSPP